MPGVDPIYRQRLVRAGLIAGTPLARGITLWREGGLEVVSALLAAYLAELRVLGDPAVTEHPFLSDSASYAEVFGSYDNALQTESRPGSPSQVLRADNMVDSVAALHDRGSSGPLVIVGGLLRRLDGPGVPLFREQYIWPAVQTTELVPPSVAEARLDEHQRALERFLGGIGLPVLTVETPAPGGYGRRCLLSVAVLPDRRPTILSTAYVMSDRYRRALGATKDVLDIGFTGKVLAMLAMHHADTAGLRLAPALAARQCVLLHDEASASQARGLMDDLARRGVRSALVPAGTLRPALARARRHALREGTPVLVAVLEDRLPRLLPRPGLGPAEDVSWERVAGAVQRHLGLVDRQLATVGRARLDRALVHGQDLQVLCGACAKPTGAFGTVEPTTRGSCQCCGRPGRLSLVVPSGRFY